MFNVVFKIGSKKDYLVNEQKLLVRISILFPVFQYISKSINKMTPKNFNIIDFLVVSFYIFTKKTIFAL